MSPKGMERFFKEVDIDGDGRVSNLEINDYISRKLSLRSEHEHKKKENAEKDIDKHIEDVFEKLGILQFLSFSRTFFRITRHCKMI